WLLWPATLGGSTTYVVTHGISMEPRFSTGDLALLRSAGSYDVGDVIAYPSPTLGTVVMHRIVARDGDAFVPEGDNNSRQDPAVPALPALPPAARARAQQAALGCAAVALLAGAGEAVLLTLPATQTETPSVTVTEQARWDWTGTAVLGATYPTGRIATGDPVY